MTSLQIIKDHLTFHHIYVTDTQTVFYWQLIKVLEFNINLSFKHTLTILSFNRNFTLSFMTKLFTPRQVCMYSLRIYCFVSGFFILFQSRLNILLFFGRYMTLMAT